jgi:hypothetical protein
VQVLSGRWGLERVAEGGTRLWAQLPRAPVTTSASTDEYDRPTSTRPKEESMSEVHVIPDDRTTWRVYDSRAAAPLSEHTNTTEAELAAHAHAAEVGAARVVVHDRYQRIHDAGTSPAGLRARAQRARVRQLDIVRERARRIARAGDYGTR